MRSTYHGDERGDHGCVKRQAERKTTFYVICADGNIRHDADFTSRYDAVVWADQGHICMRHHEFVAVDPSAVSA